MFKMCLFAFYYSILLRSVDASALTFNTFFEKKKLCIEINFNPLSTRIILIDV